MGSVDAAPPDLETVRRILREHAPELEVRAFGSRVSWTARETSDLDLALMTNEPLDAARMAALRSAFTDSRLPFRVDVVDWAGASDSFRKVIESEYVTLVGKGERRSGEGWTTMTLSRFSPLTYGKGLKSDVRNSSGHVPVFGSNGQVGWHDKALTDGPAVIVGRKGTVGSVHYSPEPCWPIDTTFFISDGDTELMRFKYYALSALDLETMNMDSAVPGLNRNAFHAREIRTPPLPEQRAIARVLGTLDDKIELNRRMNGTLEAMARALFKSWFVDFAPVRAKAEGRDTGLPDHIADLFPDRLVDSDIGEIPEGWAPRRLGECFALTMGQSPPGNTYNDHGEGLPFFQGRTDFSFRYPENRKFCIEPTRIARSGDALVSVRAPVGDINMAWEKCCIGRGVAALRHKSGSISFTYYSVRSLQNSISMYEHTGTVFGAINRKQFEEIRTLEPRPEVVETFDTLVNPLDCCIRNNVLGIRILATLRDALLPKLVSGEIRLGEAVERLESAA